MASPFADYLKKLSGLTDLYRSFRIFRFVNNHVQNATKFKLIIFTSAATISMIWVYHQIFDNDEDILKRLKCFVFRAVKRIPSVRKQIKEKSEEAYRDMCAKMHTDCGGDNVQYLSRLPSHGLNAEQVLEQVVEYSSLGKYSYRLGQLSGTVYNGSEDLTALMTDVFRHTAWSNPLHPSVFPGVRKMEAEIVRMCCDMFNGATDSCGSVTSGGTESIIMAMKSCRDWARCERGVARPEVLAPVTAHAAFDKGAQYLRMRLRYIPVDSECRCVDVDAMKRSIGSNTVMLVCSAPTYPYGNIDSVSEVAALGARYGVPVHVDACLGGFLLPFMEEAGFPIAPFDFRLPGVTSISADTHKYGFAPKGSSVVLYSGSWLHHHQYSVQPDWPGGIYASPSLAGSRSGAVIAGCWAAMRYFGRSGYVESTRKIVNTTRHLCRELENVPGLRVMAQCDVCVVAVDSPVFNIYKLLDRLDERGWNWNALQSPPGIHIAVTYCHTLPGVTDKLLADITDSAQQLSSETDHERSQQSETAALYGMTSTLPDRSLVSQLAWCYLDSIYCTR